MAIILNENTISRTPYISSSFTPPQHLHGHTFFELSFCISGHSINTVNNTPVSFQNGACVILRPGDIHAVTEYDERIYEHIDLYVTQERFKQLCNCCRDGLYEEILNEKTTLAFTFSNEFFTFLFSQALILKEMLANGDSHFEPLYISLVCSILAEWGKHKVYMQAYKPDWLKALLPKFNDVNFIHKNITQIARETGFSLPYFSSQFKKYVGLSAITYLTKKRVHLSKDLLLNPHLRILDISGMLGFENPSTFSKHFLQELKITPKEYRKQMLPHSTF